MIISECGKQRTCSCPSRDRECKWPKPCVNYANCRSAVPVFTLRPFPYCLCSDRRQSSRKEFLGCCCQLHSTKGKTKCSVSQKKKNFCLFSPLFPDISSAFVICLNMNSFYFLVFLRCGSQKSSAWAEDRKSLPRSSAHGCFCASAHLR